NKTKIRKGSKKFRRTYRDIHSVTTVLGKEQPHVSRRDHFVSNSWYRDYYCFDPYSIKTSWQRGYSSICFVSWIYHRTCYCDTSLSRFIPTNEICHFTTMLIVSTVFYYSL